MMKTLLHLLSLVPVLVYTATLSHAQLYVAGLSGHQEVPAVSSLAEGIALLEFNATGDSIDISGDVAGLSGPIDVNAAGGAHIHLGYAGSNGPVELPIGIVDNGGGNATFVDSTYFVGDRPELVAALASGEAYVNVHTVFWPGGEVRGQIVRGDLDRDFYDAMLYGEQENPPVLTDGMGGVLIEASDDSLWVTGSFSLDNPLIPAAGTGTHLHLGFFGQNGGIVLSLTPTMAAGSMTEGVFERGVNRFALPDGLVDSIDARRVYANIHSVAHPSGEIRGQVVDYGSSLYMGYVSYDAPSVLPDADAAMRVLIEKPFGDQQLFYSGSYAGFSPALFASGLTPFIVISNPFDPNPGTRASVAFPANSVSATPGEGVLPLTELTNVGPSVFVGLDVRTFSSVGLAFSGTEIPFESTIYHECKRLFGAPMTASQTVPNARSTGLGQLNVEYYGNRIEVAGDFAGLTDTLLGSNGLHIHDGFAGRAGGVVQGLNYLNQVFQTGPVTFVFPFNNTYPITTAQAQAMRDRGYYLNAHTSAFPMGEVRGQVTPRAKAYLHAPLSNYQTVPASPATGALGAAFIELTDTTVVVTGSFDNVAGFDPSIGGTGVHLHGNRAGRTGGILADLTSLAASGASSGEFFAEDNTLTLSAGLVDSMLQRNVYVNLHSTTAPSGEIRGQVAPLANAVVHARLSPEVTKPYTGTPGQDGGEGHVHGDVYPANVLLSGSWAGLGSRIDTSIMGGAHMHLGRAGITGDIAFPINLDLETGDTSATLDIFRNFFQLGPAQVSVLMGGGLYANVHTADAPSGAIRGQVLLSTNQYPGATSAFDFPADGATVDLNNGMPGDSATIDWQPATDPDDEQTVAYIWQLFTDTSAAPVVYLAQDTASEATFTFGALDTLLGSLGVAPGDNATVFHRAVATDGSLLTPGDFNTVTFTRFMSLNTEDLPASAVQLRNTLLARGQDLQLEVADLDAGTLTASIVSLQGSVMSTQPLDYSGGEQRFSLAADQPGGMYGLRLVDAEGRQRTWLFVVR